MAFSDGREKSIGTRIRLNRRDRVGMRRLVLDLTSVGIGGPDTFFMLQCCGEHQRNARQQLLNTTRFLFPNATEQSLPFDELG